MIQDHKVSVFYTAPTAIRSLIKAAEANEAVHPKRYDLSQPAHPGLGGRADQPGRLGVVPPARRRRPLPDRRHLLADGNRRPHDHAAAGRHAAGAGLLHACPSPASRRPSWTRPATTCRTARAASSSVKKPWPGMIRTIWGDPERFKSQLLSARAQGLLPGGRRRDPRRETRATSPSPAASTTCSMSRPPHGHDGDRVGAGVVHRARWPRPRWSGRPDDTTGEAICAFVVLKGARPTGDEAKKIANRAAQLGGQGDRPHRQAQGHPLRRQPAQDAQRQDHAAPAAVRSPRTRRSRRTSRRWRTRPSSISSLERN